MRRDKRDVVYVDRGGDASVKWLLWGAVIGAGLALMYAPRIGEETRRSLQRRLWKLRAMTEEKLDELVQQFGDRGSLLDEPEDEDVEPIEEPRRGGSARNELERRLADARARRRAGGEDEEPLA